MGKKKNTAAATATTTASLPVPRFQTLLIWLTELFIQPFRSDAPVTLTKAPTHEDQLADIIQASYDPECRALTWQQILFLVAHQASWFHTSDANTFICMIALSYAMILKVSDGCFLNLSRANEEITQLKKDLLERNEEVEQLKKELLERDEEITQLKKTHANSALPKTSADNQPSKAPIAEKVELHVYDIEGPLKSEKSRVADLLERAKEVVTLLKNSNGKVKIALFQICFEDPKKEEKERLLTQELREINTKLPSALENVSILDKKANELAAVDPAFIKHKCAVLMSNAKRECDLLTCDAKRTCDEITSKAKHECEIVISTALQMNTKSAPYMTALTISLAPQSVLPSVPPSVLPHVPPPEAQSRRELKKRGK
jgi:hypothetical protein